MRAVHCPAWKQVLDLHYPTSDLQQHLPHGPLGSRHVNRNALGVLTASGAPWRSWNLVFNKQMHDMCQVLNRFFQWGPRPGSSPLPLVTAPAGVSLCLEGPVPGVGHGSCPIEQDAPWGLGTSIGGAAGGMEFSPRACWNHMGSSKNTQHTERENSSGVAGVGGRGVVTE